MMVGLRIRELVVIGALTAAAFVGTAGALGGRGADSAFIYRQEHPPRLQTSAVERLLRSAPDPLTGRGRAIAARCRPGSAGRLRNPWRCTLKYRARRAGGARRRGRARRPPARRRPARRVPFRAHLRRDGYYVGRYRGGGKAVGCCLSVGAER